ncbi:MAG: hypothetical protein KGN02_15055 [bacterium]|nr:hypothetical protein [bacterium]
MLIVAAAPASAARPIVDLHKLDAYFALFASDSNVPWQKTTVRLDTYSSAPVAFTVYQVDPADVVTAGSNARARAIDTRGRRPVARFSYTPPGGYQFQSNRVEIPLGRREGFFVVEARRGAVGEQVWINRTRVGLVAKQSPGELVLYAADLGSGRALAHMRVQFVVNSRFDTRFTDAHGIVRWTHAPWPVFALAQWGSSYAFTSLFPQAPLPATIVGIRTDSAVVHAGDSLRVIGFARTRNGSVLESARGTATITMRLGGDAIAQTQAPLDAAGAFSATLPIPANAAAGSYAVLAEVAGGVGGASAHVDADAGGLSLGVNGACDGACDPNADVPVEIRSSRGGTDVHLTVVRSPHVYVGYTPDSQPWATTTWLDRHVTTDSRGRAIVDIPHPTDGLASTYGVRVESGGATAVTRVIVPTARVAVRLRVDRDTQTLGTPLGFDVFVNDVGSGKPLAGATVTAQLQHGSSTQQQTLTLDADGHARGTFSTPQLGTNLVLASVVSGGATAMDATQVNVIPQATQDTSSTSSNVRIALDRAVYAAGEAVRVNAALSGARGDAFVTLEGAQSVAADVTPTRDGRADATLRVGDAPGDLRVGAAFVRDGAIEWTSVPLALDAPGRPRVVPLSLAASRLEPGAQTTLTLQGVKGDAGTVVVRISRGAPSGSALFDTAPSLLAVGLAATQVSAPAGTTWHPWVDSTGEHAQVLGFERRGAPPKNLAIADADTQAVSWSVARDDGAPIPVQLPTERGRYTLSVLEMTDDGRVIAASSDITVQ